MQSGADIEQCDHKGDNAFILAAIHTSDAEITRMLLASEQTFDINTRYIGYYFYLVRLSTNMYSPHNLVQLKFVGKSHYIMNNFLHSVCYNYMIIDFLLKEILVYTVKGWHVKGGIYITNINSLTNSAFSR